MRTLKILLALGAVALLTGGASAAVIVGADFNDPATAPAGTLGFNAVITTAQADLGWFSNPNQARMFNFARDFSDIDFVWASEPAQPDTSEASTLNLVNDAKATTGLKTLRLDVMVQSADNPSAAPLANSADVMVSLWGYNGDAATVDGKLAAVTNAANPSGGSADITWLDSQALSAVTALDTWETQTFNIDMGAGYDYILLALSSPGSSSTLYAWGVGIDNVDIIPEPATLGVLALGGLALIRRRR